VLYRPGNLSCINPCVHNITVEAYRLRSISGTVSRVFNTCNTPCTVGYDVVLLGEKETQCYDVDVDAMRGWI
jgi:hypothetical protein